MDSHADDQDVYDDYELTIVMNNGKKAELAVPEKIYKMAMNGERWKSATGKVPLV